RSPECGPFRAESMPGGTTVGPNRRAVRPARERSRPPRSRGLAVRGTEAGASVYVDGTGSSAYADVMSVNADLEQALHGEDLDARLGAVARLRRLVERLKAEVVAGARRAGWSWRDIAFRLGVTKHTVHRKYHRLLEG